MAYKKKQIDKYTRKAEIRKVVVLYYNEYVDPMFSNPHSRVLYTKVSSLLRAIRYIKREYVPGGKFLVFEDNKRFKWNNSKRGLDLVQ